MEDKKCPQVIGKFSRVGASHVSFDGHKIYGYESTSAFGFGFNYWVNYEGKLSPSFTALFSGDGKNSDIYNMRDVPLRRICHRGGLEIVRYSSDYGGTVKVTTHEGKSHNYIMTLKGLSLNGETVLDYTERIQHLISRERRVIVMMTGNSENDLLRQYISCFIAILSGDYTIPRAYVAKEQFTVIKEPIYGTVRLDTIDGRFYLQYTRNDNGALVGEFIRTRLIPFHEEPKTGEIEGCLQENGILTPVYLSYYDPDGTGKGITREEYQQYLQERNSIIEDLLGLPRELTKLLGY